MTDFFQRLFPNFGSILVLVPCDIGTSSTDLDIGSNKKPSRIWGVETHQKMVVEPDFRYRSSVLRNDDFAESEFSKRELGSDGAETAINSDDRSGCSERSLTTGWWQTTENTSRVSTRTFPDTISIFKYIVSSTFRDFSKWILLIFSAVSGPMTKKNLCGETIFWHQVSRVFS